MTSLQAVLQAQQLQSVQNCGLVLGGECAQVAHWFAAETDDELVVLELHGAGSQAFVKHRGEVVEGAVGYLVVVIEVRLQRAV